MFEDLAIRAEMLALILDFNLRYPRRLEEAALRRCAEMLRQLAARKDAATMAKIVAKSNLRLRLIDVA